MTRKKTTEEDEDMTGAEANAAAVSFSDAMAELEGILRRIEEEETDIDQLATELRRATTLLETARGQLRKAEVEVTQIVQTLESSPPSAGRDLPEPDEDDEEEEDEDDGDDIPF
jgi:exodeoxyribonuclease VII small subunit